MSTVTGPSPLSLQLPSWKSKLTAYVALTKPRIIEQLLITTVPTMIVAKHGLPSIWLMVATVIGGTMSAGGANAINMWCDRDIDAVMKRTARRPLVRGTIKPRAALTFAIGLEVLAALWLAAFVNVLSSILAVSAALFYVFVYTLYLKRSSPSNIVIGGAAGCVPVLVGWAAVTNTVTLAPWVLFAIIFFWTPPHTWALAFKYREDYRSAEVPMLPVVASFDYTARQILAYSVVLWALTLFFVPVANMGIVYAASAVVLGAVFVGYAVKLMRDKTEKTAMQLFKYSILYVTLLFTAMALDQFIRLT